MLRRWSYIIIWKADICCGENHDCPRQESNSGVPLSSNHENQDRVTASITSTSLAIKTVINTAIYKYFLYPYFWLQTYSSWRELYFFFLSSPPQKKTTTTTKQQQQTESITSNTQKQDLVLNAQLIYGGGIFLTVRILGEGLAIQSPPALCFFKKKLSGDKLAHTNSLLYNRIGPQWLSEPRWLAKPFPDELHVSLFPS